MSDVEQEQTEQTEPEPETDEPGVSDDEAAEAEEAERAEQEPPDEPVARSESEIELEKRRTVAERKWRDHEKRLRAIYQEESEYLYPCPLCPDQHRGLIDIRFAGMVPDELADAVYAYVRGSEQVKYLPAQNVAECADCGGNGKVLSGSKVAGKDLIVCVRCKGYGFYPPLGASENGSVEPVLVPVGGGADEGPLSNEDLDVWGSPHYLADGQENSNYGKMPQYKDPRLP
jgi:rubrerythrin